MWAVRPLAGGVTGFCRSYECLLNNNSLLIPLDSVMYLFTLIQSMSLMSPINRS